MAGPDPQRPPRYWPWLLGLSLALLAAGALRHWQRTHPEPVSAPPPAPAAPAPEPALPRTAESDARIGGGLAGLSPLPAWRDWLKKGELLDRWVVILDNLLQGESPRKQLEFLAPAQPFSALAKGGRLTLDPKGCARYDAAADVIASIDAQKLAAAWKELHPLLALAWRMSGHKDLSLDLAAHKALERLAQAKVVEGEIALVRERSLYRFADPALEGMQQVEKHLVRMGPRNTRIVAGKAREVAAALGL